MISPRVVGGKRGRGYLLVRALEEKGRRWGRVCSLISPTPSETVTRVGDLLLGGGSGNKWKKSDNN